MTAAAFPVRDVLSSLVAAVRLTGSLQFCFMPSGDWETDAKPSTTSPTGGAIGTVPFHIVAEGTCWLRIDGEHHDLGPGDILLLPFDSGHQLGHGRGGAEVAPTGSLPPGPWSEVPVIRYGDGSPDVRLLCGYIKCDALRFQPLGQYLPNLVLVRHDAHPNRAFLDALIRQMIVEVDRPSTGAVPVLERLAEIVFLETIRHAIAAVPADGRGLVAALRDKRLRQALELLHGDPQRSWSLFDLAAASGMSRSSLASRFKRVLGISPMQYLREWRMYLASVDLTQTETTLAHLAERLGYGSEAAFCRAFARSYGLPPGAFRSARRSICFESAPQQSDRTYRVI